MKDFEESLQTFLEIILGYITPHTGILYLGSHIYTIRKYCNGELLFNFSREI